MSKVVVLGKRFKEVLHKSFTEENLLLQHGGNSPFQHASNDLLLDVRSIPSSFQLHFSHSLIPPKLHKNIHAHPSQLQSFFFRLS